MNYDELKKYYKKLLLKYHPDTTSLDIDDTIVKEILASYQKIFKNNKPISNNDKLMIEEKILLSIDGCYKFIINSLKYIINSRNEAIDYSYKLCQYILYLENHEGDYGTIKLLLYSLSLLINKNNNKYNSEYYLVEKKFIDYLKNIFNSSDYLELLKNTNYDKENLIQQIIILIKKIDNTNFKNKLNSMLLIILSLSEVELIDLIYKYKDS